MKMVEERSRVGKSRTIAGQNPQFGMIVAMLDIVEEWAAE